MKVYSDEIIERKFCGTVRKSFQDTYSTKKLQNEYFICISQMKIDCLKINSFTAAIFSENICTSCRSTYWNRVVNLRINLNSQELYFENISFDSTKISHLYISFFAKKNQYLGNECYTMLFCKHIWST